MTKEQFQNILDETIKCYENREAEIRANLVLSQNDPKLKEVIGDIENVVAGYIKKLQIEKDLIQTLNSSMANVEFLNVLKQLKSNNLNKQLTDMLYTHMLLS